MRKLPNQDIVIKIVKNGVIVGVGCNTFVSEDVDKAMREVTSFIKDEETGFSKKFLDDASGNQPIPQPEVCEAGRDDGTLLQRTKLS